MLYRVRNDHAWTSGAEGYNVSLTADDDGYVVWIAFNEQGIYKLDRDYIVYDREGDSELNRLIHSLQTDALHVHHEDEDAITLSYVISGKYGQQGCLSKHYVLTKITLVDYLVYMTEQQDRLTTRVENLMQKLASQVTN